MSKWVVDTNVMVVANGRHDSKQRPVSPGCREASVKFLMNLINENNCVLVDSAGEVLTEYQRYLNPCGQPGTGDRLLYELRNNCRRIKMVDLPVDENGEYADLHPDIIASAFDRSDRKFVALALQKDAPVANSVDSDWVDHFALLTRCGVKVKLICGQNQADWYEPVAV